VVAERASAQKTGVFKQSAGAAKRHSERSEESAFEHEAEGRKADSSSFLLGMTVVEHSQNERRSIGFAIPSTLSIGSASSGVWRAWQYGNFDQEGCFGP
jgi:hypothetical protein